jgi:hypothetical protein
LKRRLTMESAAIVDVLRVRGLVRPAECRQSRALLVRIVHAKTARSSARRRGTVRVADSVHCPPAFFLLSLPRFAALAARALSAVLQHIARGQPTAGVVPVRP